MKRISLLFAIAAMFFTTANAQMSDVTAQYISNSGFEECAIATTVDGVVQLVANDKNPVDYADKGWTFKEGYDGSSSFNAGVAEYPIKVKYSKWLAGLEGPATGPTAEANTKAMCFTGSKSALYKQTDEITLPAGSYKLTVNVWAYNGGTTNPSPTIDVKNGTGFVTTSGTEYLSTKKMFKSSDWDTDIIEIELTAPTTGRFQITYGSSYFVTIDNLKLEYAGGVITTALQNVITKAKALNKELNNSDLGTAIAAAEDFVNNPTDQDAVTTQIETLYSAMGSALSATTVPVNITAAYLENASFESGSIDPWAWGTKTGSVTEPINEFSLPYIVGKYVVEFTQSGSNKFTQTVTHLPSGYYLLDAKLNSDASVIIANATNSCTGGTDALFIRACNSPLQFVGGDMEVGASSNAAFRADDFRLFYANDEASLQALNLAAIKADAQAIIADNQFVNVTGDERTDLEEALNGTDGTVINKMVNAFFKAKDAYNDFVKAKTAAAPFTKENYPYAKAETLELIQSLVNSTPVTRAMAQEKATQLVAACKSVVIENAYCDGIEGKTDYTTNIVAADATGSSINGAWTASNMAIRNISKNKARPNKDGTTDRVVYGTAESYSSTNTSVTASIEQTISGLPAGDYVLSIAMMAKKDLPIAIRINNSKKATFTGTGTVTTDNWAEVVVSFTKADANSLTIRLEESEEVTYKEWYFDNFRLYALPNIPEGISDVTTESQKSKAIYDLQGRRVAQPAQGLYIVGGKKVIMK